MHDWFKSYSDFNAFLHFFKNVLLLPFTKFKSQINQLQKDFLGKSNKRMLVSEFAMSAQKWSKIPRKNIRF